jgi:transketolase
MIMQNSETILKIRRLAAKIRKDIVMMIGCEGQTGHLGGSCSSADIVAALYGHRLRHDPRNPKWEERDRFIYSKGHAAIAQYAALAETGYFPVEELKTVKSLGSRLQGHPDMLKTPGVEAGTGSLGHGLSVSNGMALAMRLDARTGKVFCVIGDGELNEGQIWEAAMTAAYYKLDNLVAIVDRNHLQATGPCAERFGIDPIAEKWRSFGWHVIELDGHDIQAILDAFNEADSISGKPTVLIADTVKGKGISFAENVASFHNGMLTKEQYEIALQELDKELESLVSTESGEMKHE